MIKIRDVRWFNGCGIVRCVDEIGNVKYYIKDIEGDDPDIDMSDIAHWGSKFPNDAGDVLFGVK